MKVTRTSIVSGDTHQFEFDITPDQWIAYSSGELKIQDAFPHLKPWEREFIMSGITEDEWNELFPPDEEDGDENEDFMPNDDNGFDDNDENLIN